MADNANRSMKEEYFLQDLHTNLAWRAIKFVMLISSLPTTTAIPSWAGLGSPAENPMLSE